MGSIGARRTLRMPRCAECNDWSVRIEDRFNAIAHDPVRRLIKVHAQSLARAAHRHSASVAPACCEADAGQCRIIINALRREIDRLLRGIDRFPQHGHCRCHPQTPRSTNEFSGDPQPADMMRLASASSTPKLYAAAPLGPALASLRLASMSPNSTSPSAAGPSFDHLGAVIDLVI